MGVSKNSGIPKSSILIGFPIMNHPLESFQSFFVSDFVNAAEGFTSDQREGHTTKSVAHAPGTL